MIVRPLRRLIEIGIEMVTLPSALLVKAGFPVWLKLISLLFMPRPPKLPTPALVFRRQLTQMFHKLGC
jgi:hypothetical protein